MTIKYTFDLDELGISRRKEEEPIQEAPENEYLQGYLPQEFYSSDLGYLLENNKSFQVLKVVAGEQRRMLVRSKPVGRKRFRYWYALYNQQGRYVEHYLGKIETIDITVLDQTIEHLAGVALAS